MPFPPPFNSVIVFPRERVRDGSILTRRSRESILWHHFPKRKPTPDSIFTRNLLMLLLKTRFCSKESLVLIFGYPLSSIPYLFFVFVGAGLFASPLPSFREEATQFLSFAALQFPMPTRGKKSAPQPSLSLKHFPIFPPIDDPLLALQFASIATKLGGYLLCLVKGEGSWANIGNYALVSH